MAKRPGTLTVITGPMYCGKSELLIRTLNDSVSSGTQTLAFRPAADDRSALGFIESRDGTRFPAEIIERDIDIGLHVSRVFRHANSRLLIGVDEVQMFGPTLVSLLNGFAQLGIDVVASGLDTDYRGWPCGIVPQLLAMADVVIKRTAVCAVCGGPATRSQIKVPVPKNPPPGFFVDTDGDKYEARCRVCHVYDSLDPL